ncbi:hypothetical protein [Streptomyces sp. NPDC051997]|uniref:hypothetical protein n=1 Tax=Streptomyces sp. NPDC051997 TaxID=3155611 RepID=UPI00343BEE5B
MTTQATEPTTTFRAQQDARRRIETSYETTVAVQELPSLHVAWEATPTSVLVTSTDMDVLGEWLYVMKGSITTVDLPSGQTVWTLRTETWSDSPRFPVVPVFVTVVQATGTPVMAEIAAAVTR